MSKRHAATIAARAGIAQDTAFGAVTPPLYLTSTYELKAFKQPGQYDYSRSNNPTRDLLAQALAELEGGAGQRLVRVPVLLGEVVAPVAGDVVGGEGPADGEGAGLHFPPGPAIAGLGVQLTPAGAARRGNLTILRA